MLQQEAGRLDMTGFPEVLVALDRLGQVVFQTDAFRKLPESADSTGPQQTICKDVLLSACRRVLATGHLESFEMHGDRGEEWIECIIAPLKQNGPRPKIVICSCHDITAHKSVEAHLRRGHSLLVDAEGIAHFGTWQWEVNQAVVEWSDELYRIYGVAQSDYRPTYKAFLDKIHPDDRERVINAMNRVFNEHVSFSHDERIIRPDGEVRYLHTWGHPYFDNSGNLIRLVGVCQDITDRTLGERDAKNKLERSMSCLRATLESTAEGLLVMDMKEVIVDYNTKFLELWNIPSGYIENKGYRQALAYVLDQLKNPDKCVARLIEIFADPIAESHDVIEFKDGRIFERHSRPQILDGRPVGRVFSYRDITERVRSDRRIREFASRMKTLADASQTFASARLDLAAVLKDVSRWLAETFQDASIVRLFSADQARLEMAAFHHGSPQVLGQMKELIPSAANFIDAPIVEEVLRTGQATKVSDEPLKIRARVSKSFQTFLERYPVHDTMVAPLRTGGQIIGLITVFRFRDEPGYVSEDLEFLQDLADRAALAIENANLYAQAQRAIELRDDFISIASHELKTPLTPLSVQLQLLRDILKKQSFRSIKNLAPLLKMIDSSDLQIERLTRLVEDMLDVSRISMGRLNLRRESLDLVELTRQVVERFEPQIATAKCTVKVHAAGPVKGRWDPGRIEQVVNNLLSNAVKYGAGRPVEIGVEMNGGTARFTIRDEGLGISQQDQQRIFNRFERAASVKRFGGLGLGLFIARQIVEAHGGTIGVVSSPDAGATFRVELPHTL